MKYEEIDNLINSEKYKGLELYRKDDIIYTNKYDKDYVGYSDVLSLEAENKFVCSFTNKDFIFGLINYFISYNEYYNWDEELESRSTELHIEFLSKDELSLFLNFELDLLNLLDKSKPEITKKLSIKHRKFDTDVNSDKKYTVYYKGKEFMQYYLVEYDDRHEWYLRMLSCADIDWVSFEYFPTHEDNDYNYLDNDDDYYDYYYGDSEAQVNSYKNIDFKTAKDIVFTLLDIIKKLD